jgi:hypothetical protein
MEMAGENANMARLFASQSSQSSVLGELKTVIRLSLEKVRNETERVILPRPRAYIIP